MATTAWLLLWMLAPAVQVVSATPLEQGCPSPQQVEAALAAKLPAPPEGSSPPAPLRLVLTAGPPAQIELLDDAGQPVLRRMFARHETPEPADCAALAETIALIVDRYVHDLDVRGRSAPVPGLVVPLPPAPPPPAQRLTDVAVLVGTSWRGDADPLQGVEALLGVDLQRAARERGAGATITVGVAPMVDGSVPAGRATLRRIPLRLGTYVSLLAGPGRLEPGLNLGIDALFVEVKQAQMATRVIRNVSPNVEAAMAYRLRGGVYFARGALAAGLAVPYRLVGDPGQDPVLSTPRTYIRIGVETGFYFH